MSIAFIDFSDEHIRLHPLTLTRPSCELRVGILTIREKWEHQLGEFRGYFVPNYLGVKYSPPNDSKADFLINGRMLPNKELVSALQKLEPNACLKKHGVFLGARMAKKISLSDLSFLASHEYSGELSSIDRTWDIFLQNGEEIRKDFDILTRNRKSAPLSDSHTVVYGTDLFIEPGVQIRASVLNCEGGPIYLGANSQVSEGAIIQGPFAACEGAMISLGAHIRPNTTIGPYSRAGGEVSNSVIQGYSSKGHGGFLGNSVIGEWCNLGAGTNNSNLKNTYKKIDMWDYETSEFVPSDQQFLGLIMGDHSKVAINTMFSTGSTVGVNSNIFGAGFPKTFIPSFAWGGSEGFATYRLEQALETAELVLARRNKSLQDSDRSILSHIFDISMRYRRWENQ